MCRCDGALEPWEAEEKVDERPNEGNGDARTQPKSAARLRDCCLSSTCAAAIGGAVEYATSRCKWCEQALPSYHTGSRSWSLKCLPVVIGLQSPANKRHETRCLRLASAKWLNAQVLEHLLARPATLQQVFHVLVVLHVSGRRILQNLELALELEFTACL